MAGPGELLTGEPRIPQPDVQLDRVRIKRKALFEHLEGPFVVTVVVQLVRLLVVFLGTEEPFGHLPLLPGERRCRR